MANKFNMMKHTRLSSELTKQKLLKLISFNKAQGCLNYYGCWYK